MIVFNSTSWTYYKRPNIQEARAVYWTNIYTIFKTFSIYSATHHGHFQDISQWQYMLPGIRVSDSRREGTLIAITVLVCNSLKFNILWLKYLLISKSFAITSYFLHQNQSLPMPLKIQCARMQLPHYPLASIAPLHHEGNLGSFQYLGGIIRTGQ